MTNDEKKNLIHESIKLKRQIDELTEKLENNRERLKTLMELGEKVTEKYGTSVYNIVYQHKNAYLQFDSTKGKKMIPTWETDCSRQIGECNSVVITPKR